VSTLTDHVVFHDQKLASRYANEKIPMTTLFEAYLDGDVDIKDMTAFLTSRNDMVKYSVTPEHFKFFFTRLIPEVAIHSKKQDERIVREHYDRGDDFFAAFLGDRMVYTCGFFLNANETVEQAQDNKMDLVCNKLMLKPGENMLDIGCGWGTLARHAATKYGADATGVTISKNQTAFGNGRIQKAGVADRARILCCDYRDIPRRQFDKISSLEMVEHVGVKNYPKFCSLVYELLKDDGLFLLQWTGLRRGGETHNRIPVVGLRPEDLVWGLFMAKYIFPGADASSPPSDMLRGLEKAGFEIHSLENISVHYAITIEKWHQNWISNEAEIKKSYGERWYRLWHLFLGWSTRIGFQGNAACFQIVAHKNLDSFDRRIFLGPPALGEQERQKMFENKQHAPSASAKRNGKRVET
jgi:cyclopropane fatty-acyl-phospholipid synthase-like methyltransferase